MGLFFLGAAGFRAGLRNLREERPLFSLRVRVACVSAAAVALDEGSTERTTTRIGSSTRESRAHMHDKRADARSNKGGAETAENFAGVPKSDLAAEVPRARRCGSVHREIIYAVSYRARGQLRDVAARLFPDELHNDRAESCAALESIRV